MESSQPFDVLDVWSEPVWKYLEENFKLGQKHLNRKVF